MGCGAPTAAGRTHWTWVASKQRQTAQPKTARPLARWRDGREISATQASPRANLTWREAGGGGRYDSPAAVYPRAGMTMQASTYCVVLRHCCHLARSQDLVTLLRLFRRCGAGPAGTGHTRSLPNLSTSEHLPTSLWPGRFPSTVFDLGKSRCHLILTDGRYHGSPTANPGNKTGRVGTLVGHRHPPPPLRVVGAVPTVLSGGGPVRTWSTTQLPSPILSILLAFVG